MERRERDAVPVSTAGMTSAALCRNPLAIWRVTKGTGPPEACEELQRCGFD
jgi:hypothetical protein